MNRMTMGGLKGLTVISIAEGARVGAINRIYIDPSARQIVGISVEPGSSLLEPDSRKLIDVQDIHSLGPDALTVASAESVRGDQTNDQWMSLVDVDDLTKRKVVTEGGEFVGEVAAVYFDKQSYRLTDIESSPGFFKSNTKIPIDQVTTIGPEVVVVSNSVCAQPSDTMQEQEQEQDTSAWVVGDIEGAGS